MTPNTVALFVEGFSLSTSPVVDMNNGNIADIVTVRTTSAH